MQCTDGLIPAYGIRWTEPDAHAAHDRYSRQESHKERLRAIEELCADFTMRTGRSLATTSVSELLRWSWSMVHDDD